jgi:hypothetical protein
MARLSAGGVIVEGYKDGYSRVGADMVACL